MATNIQRMQAVGDALINGVATASQLSRLGEALAKNGSVHSEYVAAATNGEKAAIAVRELRKMLIGVIKNVEAESAIQNAASSTHSAVDAQFQDS